MPQVPNQFGTLSRDANGLPIQLGAPAFQLSSGAQTVSVTAVSVTSDVATLTTESHNFVPSQKIYVELSSTAADIGGATYTIATAPDPNTITFELTHENLGDTPITGSVSAYWESPITSSGVTLIFWPDKAVSLTVKSNVSVLLLDYDVQEDEVVSRSAGTYPIPQDVEFSIPGRAGGVTAIDTGSDEATIHFEFDTLA